MILLQVSELFYSDPKTSDVSWMNMILFTIAKVIEHKLKLFEHTQSISKWPVESVYIGDNTCYPTYLLASYPRGPEVDLERSIRFPILMLLMHIYRLGLVSQLY